MIEQLAEKLIRKRVSENCFDVSAHAHQRMAERQIDILDTPLIVTVCRTKDEAWECVDSVLRRRRRY